MAAAMRYRGRRKRDMAVKKEDLSFCNHPCLQSIYTTDIKLNCQCGHIGQNLFSWKFGDTNGGEANFVDTDTVLGKKDTLTQCIKSILFVSSKYA